MGLAINFSIAYISRMLSGPKQKFCEGIVSALNATDAYRAAYPNSSAQAARRSASDLLTKPDIIAEIARLRKAAECIAGSAVMTLAEKRAKLAGIVREASGEHDACTVSLSDKLKAIALDNDLAGDGSEAKGNEGLSALIARIRK